MAVLNQVGLYTSPVGAEIVTYDADRQALYVVSGNNELEVLDVSDPTNPTLLFTVDLEAAAGIPIGGANSVAYQNGVLAVAIEAAEKTDPGVVALINLDTYAINPAESIQVITVGSLPDMVTFTPDGTTVLVANEAEPNNDYTIDPEGSIGIIDISGGVGNATVAIADFTAYNSQLDSLKADGVRIFGPGATVAQDFEPEYISVSADSSTAYVTLQENNAVAVVDIATATVTDILPLGYKDYSTDNVLDASNEDGGINLQNWPVLGMYQPDSIATYTVGGETYFITANEGDSRDYDGFSEEARVADVVLDPIAFPNAEELQKDENLGRLKITTTLGDPDGDGDYDELYVYGGRSFSIWDSQGNQVYDSGSFFEQITADQIPAYFNSDDGSADEFDQRSDDKGPEPEALTIGEVDGKTYAFIGLERTGGIMVYDITDPYTPTFIEYIDYFIDAPGNISPEGFEFVSAEDSPNGVPLLVVAHEVSGTVAVFEFNPGNPTDQVFFDLQDITGVVTTEFTVNREAAYDNFVGFYAVVDGNGGVDTNGDGVADVLPGDAGYTDAVLAHYQPEIALVTNDGEESVFQIDVTGGALYAPFIIADGNPADPSSFASEDVFFAFAAANADGQQHIKFENGTLLFEDWLGPNSDMDFNDAVITIVTA